MFLTVDTKSTAYRPWCAARLYFEIDCTSAYTSLQGQTKRRDGKSSRLPKSSLLGGGRSRGGEDNQTQIKKATFEITKKKEVGVSDLTLLSKVSNEAINENLKKRFEHGEIYVRPAQLPSSWKCPLILPIRLILAMSWSLSIPFETVSCRQTSLLNRLDLS